MIPIAQLDTCPACQSQWKGEDILTYFKQRRDEGDIYWSSKTDAEIEQAAGYYGWTTESPKCWSRLLGIEDPQLYDGVSYWRCPDCGATWDRWTDARLVEESRQ